MTYEESLTWLYSTQQFGIKLGLENIRGLLKALGDPHDHLSFLHVAGTNGKGSVCAILDSILRAAGCRTGLYTSPHLVDFRERIRVDGTKIPREAVAGGLEVLRDLAADWAHSPTFFELATALALRHFAESRCELVVLETGMGGRLDATNAVVPVTSVITPVALDHTRWLGGTLAEIAGEKAGIIKPGVPVVSARQHPEAAAVLTRRAEELASPLCFVDGPAGGWEVALRGIHQRENAALAVAALGAAGLKISDREVARGLRDISWPGRFQIIEARLVLDGCHNPHAANQLLVNWKDFFGSEKATIIFGALGDKDYPAMLEILKPISREVFFVPVRSERSTVPEALALACTVPHRIFPSAKDALDASRGKTLVTGSLFLVGEVLELLGFEP
ncbi:MAG TPA: folylpolyglutamate synthase/dihydrofolate synthase family protein [Terrimicrobiaceae bacterium]